MGHWTTALPAPATEGSHTHLQDHDALTAALAEVRDVVDELARTLASLAGRLDAIEQPVLPDEGDPLEA